MDESSTIIKKAEECYRQIKSVYCPYLKESVSFNAKGLEHLKFKSRDKARSLPDQLIRLTHVDLAHKIVATSHTVQGIYQTGEEEELKTNGRWEKRLKRVLYYEFIAVLRGKRFKVIVKKVEGGQPHFWSIIPNWRIDKTVGRRLLYDGCPDQD
jgi:hypothetical protein